MARTSHNALKGLKVISRLTMNQPPKGLNFVHWTDGADTCPHHGAGAAHGAHGQTTSGVASRVTCPTCRLAMIRAGKAKAVPKFGAIVDGKLYL